LVKHLQLSACAQEGPPPEGLRSTSAFNTVRLAAGQLLGGRYRIERELGEGRLGVVYLAADEQVPGERFAIKEGADASLTVVSCWSE